MSNILGIALNPRDGLHPEEEQEQINNEFAVMKKQTSRHRYYSERRVEDAKRWRNRSSRTFLIQLGSPTEVGEHPSR